MWKRLQIKTRQAILRWIKWIIQFAHLHWNYVVPGETVEKTNGARFRLNQAKVNTSQRWRAIIRLSGISVESLFCFSHQLTTKIDCFLCIIHIIWILCLARAHTGCILYKIDCEWKTWIKYSLHITIREHSASLVHFPWKNNDRFRWENAYFSGMSCGNSPEDRKFTEDRVNSMRMEYK